MGFITVQLGFIRGVYKIVDNNRATVVQGIYHISLARIFETKGHK